MREQNFFSSFKMRLKIHFLSKSRSVKINGTKFNFKSIGDNLKIATFLIFNRFVKKVKKNEFFGNIT
jgi:hypothetical protein